MNVKSYMMKRKDSPMNAPVSGTYDPGMDTKCSESDVSATKGLHNSDHGNLNERLMQNCLKGKQ